MDSSGFAARVERETGRKLLRSQATTVQVNATRRCNLACHHCHVESSPRRSETLTPCAVERIAELLDRSPEIACLDLTGGAPEMSDQFRNLVRAGRERGLEVIDRCNLTIFYEPGFDDLPEFLADEGVTIVASLPCYTRENVDRQRGRHVFDRSIDALQRLMALGYGGPSADLALDLVYNPQGPTLPPEQRELEARYRAELRELFKIEFRALLTITNMAVKRFATSLERSGELAAYQALLVNHFNPDAAGRVMCRELVSVDHLGRLFDCDFNQQLELPLSGTETTLWDIESFADLTGRPVATDRHCFGCTAGAGSSCSGTLA